MKGAGPKIRGAANVAGGGNLRKLFVGVTPGLEGLLINELRSLPGLRTGKHSVNWHPHDGGVEGMVTNEEMWTIAWKSRQATSSHHIHSQLQTNQLMHATIVCALLKVGRIAAGAAARGSIRVEELQAVCFTAQEVPTSSSSRFIGCLAADVNMCLAQDSRGRTTCRQ
jgi:hypothetical protein